MPNDKERKKFSIPEGYDPRDDDLFLWNEKATMSKYEITNILTQVVNLRENSKLNPYQKLKKWGDVGADIIKYMVLILDLIDCQNRVVKRFMTDSAEKKYKRWTDEEDNLLIDMVCADMSSMDISITLGRSPSAIKTRVSKLVGINRLSQQIAGRFIGELNGAKIEGNIKGTLSKDK